jgi:hypothetical protein
MCNSSSTLTTYDSVYYNLFLHIIPAIFRFLALEIQAELVHRDDTLTTIYRI